MKQGCILLSVLLLCSALLGCQPATDGSSLAADVNPRQASSQSVSDPITGPATVATESTAATAVSEPLPAEPPVNRSVTPINTYVFPPESDLYMFSYENVILVEGDRLRYPNTLSIPLGEVFISPKVQKAMDENPDDAICYVYVSYLQTYDPEVATLEDYDALGEELRARFVEAGYVVYDNKPDWIMPPCCFGVFISVEQLRELDCGDDVAVCIFRYYPNYW